MTLAAASMLVAAAAYDPVTALAGRYSRHFRNATVDGTRYWSDDVVEVVPLDRRHAYVRVATHFFNGHSCSLAGVAAAAGDALVYRDPVAGDAGTKCVLSLRRDGPSLRLDDGAGSCQDHCGARGTLSGAGLPWRSRRTITYRARLTSSDRYRAAIAAWRDTGRQQ